MDRRIQQALALLESDPTRRWRLAELARHVGLSESRLRHLLRTELPTSFVKYIRRRRLEVAKRLLEETDLSVKEVVASVGFGHQSRFTKDFRHVYGLPPAVYRHSRRHGDTP